MEPRQWVRRALVSALDQVYPPLCTLCGAVEGSYLCSGCLATFQRLSLPIREIDANLTACFRYEGRIRQAIHALKYRRATGLVEPLSQLLASRLDSDFDLVVPVPIHWTRRAWRGFNQSELLCDAVPPSKVGYRALSRTRMTKPQAQLNEKQRESNVAGAFFAKNRLEGMSVVLVDDVATTGSTLKECRTALLAAGAREVHMLVLAAAV